MIEAAALLLQQSKFTLEPGGASFETLFSVTNQSSVVDEFRLRVEGLDAEWFTLSESTLRLFPGTEASAQLSVRVPTNTLAGNYPFQLIAVSGQTQDLPARVDASIEVPVSGGVEMRARPQRIRGRRIAESTLELRSTRNAHVHVSLLATDPDGLMRFGVRPKDIVLAPGAEVTARVRVRLPDARLGGPIRYRQLLVAALLAEDLLQPPLAGTSIDVLQLPLVAWLVSLAGTIKQWAIAAAVLVIGVAIAVWYLGAPGEAVPVPDLQQPLQAPALAAAEAAQGGRGGALSVVAAAQTGPVGEVGQAGLAAGMGAIATGAAPPPPPVAAVKPIPTLAPARVAHFGVVQPSDEPAPTVPLQWDVRGADAVRIEQGAAIPADPYDTVEQRAYTLTATNAAGADTQSLTLYVVRPPSIDVFSADNATITSGGSVYLLWRTSRAVDVFLDDARVDSPEAGSVTLQPASNHTYVLRAESPAGTTEQFVSVTVNPPPTPTPLPTPVPTPIRRPPTTRT